MSEEHRYTIRYNSLNKNLKLNIGNIGETIKDDTFEITTLTDHNFSDNEIIIGETSNARAYIMKVINYNDH